MKKFASAFVFLALSVSVMALPKQHKLTSPDGSVAVEVGTDGRISYSVTVDGVQVLSPSVISVTLNDGKVYDGAARLRKVIKSSADNIIKAQVYRKAEVRDNYNQLEFRYKDFNLIFRAYDDGVAYRFVSLSAEPFEVKSEQAEFSFPANWNAYVPYVVQNLSDDFDSQLHNSFENHYDYQPVAGWDKRRAAFLPLMVEAEGGVKLCITEADLMNYPGMYLYNGDCDNTLSGYFPKYPTVKTTGGGDGRSFYVQETADYIAKFDKGGAFPWRVIGISRHDWEMTDNDMVYRLASAPDPSVDYSWVKPGKVAWDWWNNWNIYGVNFKSGVNNDTYKYYIDFASKNGIQYIIMDEGWSVGFEDLFHIVPEINLEELIAYGKERNVGIILWAGYGPFQKDIEKACKVYSEMGVKGFKVDFMDACDQPVVDFHRRTAEIAAKYRMMIDFHGTYKPTGLHRTYPNVLNFEGVYGLENLKWNKNVDQVTYETIIPFIRFFAGPADYTQGAMRNANKDNYRAVWSEAMSQGTRCRQLAEYVIFSSPLNMLCDSPSNYMNEPECTEYIANVPEVWDETVALDGKVGEYVVTARRKGDVWYVGAITNWDERDLEINIDFLGEGKHIMTAFKDGINADKAARDYKKCEAELKPGKALKAHLAPGGGFVAIIR